MQISCFYINWRIVVKKIVLYEHFIERSSMWIVELSSICVIGCFIRLEKEKENEARTYHLKKNGKQHKLRIQLRQRIRIKVQGDVAQKTHIFWHDQYCAKGIEYSTY